MSTLSREIARWISTNPGIIYGDDEANVFEKARAAFMMSRRWKQPCPMDVFIIHLRTLGYMPTARLNHDTGASRPCLHFPEPHIGR